MPSKALLSNSALLRAPQVALPLRIAEIDGFELVAQCDRCGRLHRLYPGHADFGANTRVASLLQRVLCRAPRDGRPCAGRPRRLILARDERRWVLETPGAWVEDDSAYWEAEDFEAAPRH